MLESDGACGGDEAKFAGLQEAWRQAGGGEADALEDAWGDALAQQAGQAYRSPNARAFGDRYA